MTSLGYAIAHHLEALRTVKFWKEFIIMTLGMLITAIAVYYFLVPSKLIIGTTSGLAIVVSDLLDVIGFPVKVSICLTVINTILLILAFFLIDGEFGIKTVYASLVLGPLMDLLELIYPYTKLLTEPGQTSVMGDIWFDLLCFVFLLSAAQAILFHINGSTGGLDIVAKILNKYMHIDIGTAIIISGAVVSSTAFARQLVMENKSTEAPETNPAKESTDTEAYEFAGWFTSADGGTLDARSPGAVSPLLPQMQPGDAVEAVNRLVA